MTAGVKVARRRRGTMAGVVGAALLVGSLVLDSGGAYAQPSPGPTPTGRSDARPDGKPGDQGGAGHDGKGGDGHDGRRDDGHNGDGHGGGTSADPSRSTPAAPKPTASTSSVPAAPTGSPFASPQASARPAPPAAGLVLRAADDDGAATPTTQGLRQALAAALQDQSLGTVTFAVADAASGHLLYGSGENTPGTPASTTKLATALATLSLVPSDTRIATRVVKGAAPGEITLVGGGDPTLTALPADQVQLGGMPADADTAPASLQALAAKTAVALKQAGTTTVSLGYDTSLYVGSTQHKNYDAANIAMVTPLMADEGRVDPKSREDAPARVADPADQAAGQFAVLLKAQGITVEGKPKQVTPATATGAPATATTGAATPGATPPAAVLAQVESPTVARLVERMLTTSDNTLAEALARQAALAAHRPASFEGAATAVTTALTGLGVQLTGVVLNDGSGLHTGNAIPPAVLVQLLALAAAPNHPELRPVLTGLPIAGFTGTLGKRFAAGSGSAEAAGIVRAKTGTLSGVNTLAGTVVDADGRLLAFAVMTRTTAAADTARAAMDRIAARLGACGCH
ncbi:D-alanyl-D-alanine carboxypeptidase/D-alanyl-D-alanine-endopeptidase [Kitasatospora sp. NPDC050543]|uniref:D-alanyl-D-alanine carboxypeptidase/D-alanyl-D-alanine endopeptidase n=1 Tax=Kitasatospora sp. NPDC050543 TaxID=3364054 RepID=UPI00378EC032